jgi:hypothetical protein
MSDTRVWHVMEEPPLRVQFRWHGRPPEQFTQSQLRATIQVLRQQGRPTAEYEAGLAGLLELEGKK